MLKLIDIVSTSFWIFIEYSFYLGNVREKGEELKIIKIKIQEDEIILL